MQPVLLSSLAERPHTCRVFPQHRLTRHLPAMLRNARQAGRAPLRQGGRERRPLQLQLPDGLLTIWICVDKDTVNGKVSVTKMRIAGVGCFLLTAQYSFFIL